MVKELGECRGTVKWEPSAAVYEMGPSHLEASYGGEFLSVPFELQLPESAGLSAGVPALREGSLCPCKVEELGEGAPWWKYSKCMPRVPRACPPRCGAASASATASMLCLLLSSPVYLPPARWSSLRTRPLVLFFIFVSSVPG